MTRIRCVPGSVFVGSAYRLHARRSLPIPARIGRRSRVRAGGFGNGRAPRCLYHCVMTRTSQQARLHTRPSCRGERPTAAASSAAPTSSATTARIAPEDTTSRVSQRVGAATTRQSARAVTPRTTARFSFGCPGTYAVRLSRMTTEAVVRDAGPRAVRRGAGRQGGDAWPRSARVRSRAPARVRRGSAGLQPGDSRQPEGSVSRLRDGSRSRARRGTRRAGLPAWHSQGIRHRRAVSSGARPTPSSTRSRVCSN